MKGQNEEMERIKRWRGIEWRDTENEGKEGGRMKGETEGENKGKEGGREWGGEEKVKGKEKKNYHSWMHPLSIQRLP